MGPRPVLDRCGKSRPHRDSISGPSRPQQFAIMNELPGPQCSQQYECVILRVFFRQVGQINSRVLQILIRIQNTFQTSYSWHDNEVSSMNLQQLNIHGRCYSTSVMCKLLPDPSGVRRQDGKSGSTVQGVQIMLPAEGPLNLGAGCSIVVSQPKASVALFVRQNVGTH